MRRLLFVTMLLTVVLLMLCWQGVSCLSLETQWSKTYGGANSDSAQSVIPTLDGGYIVLGATQSYGAGGIDFWLVKIDDLGNVEWDKTYGGTSNDMPYSVIQTSDGGYAMTGHTMSFGAGAEDFWLVKTDELGNMQWSKTFGGLSQDIAYSLVQTSDSGFALAGQTWSFGAGWSNAWLIKTDESGNMEWNKTYSKNNYDPAYFMMQTPDGGYVVAGRTASYQSFGDGDFWLIKTDTAGNVEWDRTYGGAGEETAHSVVQTLDGGYAIAGLANSFGAGSFDTWLVKTDSYGDVEWSKTYGGTDIDWVHSAVQTSDGGYMLACLCRSFGAGAADYWLVKTDCNGNAEWDKTYGGVNEDVLYSFAQTSDGGFILAGFTESFGAGSRDFWLIKLAPPKSARATIDVSPDTLNLRSRGKWIAAYIELPEGYDVNGINVSAILLNDTITIDPAAPTTIGDYDSDGVPDLMVKFDRADVQQYILDNVPIEAKFMTATLTVTGELNDGTLFQGSDTIKIIFPMNYWKVIYLEKLGIV